MRHDGPPDSRAAGRHRALTPGRSGALTAIRETSVQVRSSRTMIGTKAAAPPGVGDHLGDPLRRQRDQLRERIERGRAGPSVCSRDHEDPIGRAVARERHAVAIEDPAARRRQQAMVDPVLVGEQRVLVGGHHLQVVEPRRRAPRTARAGPPPSSNARRENARRRSPSRCMDQPRDLVVDAASSQLAGG